VQRSGGIEIVPKLKRKGKEKDVTLAYQAATVRIGRATIPSEDAKPAIIQEIVGLLDHQSFDLASISNSLGDLRFPSLWSLEDGTDAVSGAMNKYPDQVTVAMSLDPGCRQQQPPASGAPARRHI